MRAGHGIIGVVAAGLLVLCATGCMQSAESQAPAPTETATPSPSPDPLDTPDPEAAALADVLGAKDDESRSVKERACALSWASAALGGDYAPDCYLPGVDTDALELEPLPTPAARTAG